MWNYILPSYRCAGIKGLFPFASKARRLMQMNSCLGAKQLLCKVDAYEFAETFYSFLGFGQQIFVPKQPVAAKVLEPTMYSRCPLVLVNNEPHAQFPNKPRKPRVLQHLDP